MMEEMSKSDSKTQKDAELLFLKEPETLAEYDIDYTKSNQKKSDRFTVMTILKVMTGFDTIENCHKDTVSYWLTLYPEFTEEVRQLRPELLEK